MKQTTMKSLLTMLLICVVATGMGLTRLSILISMPSSAPAGSFVL